MNTPHTGESLDHYAKFEKDTKDQIMCDANHRKCQKQPPDRVEGPGVGEEANSKGTQGHSLGNRNAPHHDRYGAGLNTFICHN